VGRLVTVRQPPDQQKGVFDRLLDLRGIVAEPRRERQRVAVMPVIERGQREEIALNSTQPTHEARVRGGGYRALTVLLGGTGPVIRIR
jgi:hypothetical protein